MPAVPGIFNKSSLKLLLAMAIPTGIAYFFWYSQHQANVEVEQYKKEQKEHPSSDSLVIQNYGMKEVDGSNNVRWQLVASKGIIQPNGQDVELNEVKMEYFDLATKHLKMCLTAPIGYANQQTKFVKLLGNDKRKVVADGQEG